MENRVTFLVIVVSLQLPLYSVKTDALDMDIEEDYFKDVDDDHEINRIINNDVTGKLAAIENSPSRDVGVAKYLGLGYDLFRANPFSTQLDPGLKSNSIKPAKLLKTFYDQQKGSCPQLTQCLRFPKQTTQQEIYVKSFQDYQQGIAQHLYIYGKSTSSVTNAIGVLERSSSQICHQLADGIFFADFATFEVSEEAELDFRSSRILHAPLVSAICQLSLDYQHDEYVSLLKEFGTHIVVKVRLANLTIHRITIDSPILYREFLDHGIPVNGTRRNSGGYSLEYVTRGLIARVTKVIRANASQNTTFTTVQEIPIVTAITEIATFITKERLSRTDIQQDSCRNLEPAVNIGANIQKLQDNMARALTEYALESQQTITSTQPDFLPWPPAILNQIQNEANKATSDCAATLVEDATMLGKGYDIFRADPFTSQVDPGIHLTPALLQRKICSQGESCDQVTSCATASPNGLSTEEHRISAYEDYVAQVKGILRFPDQIPVDPISKIAAASSSIKAVKRILASGSTMVDTITVNATSEILLNYRMMQILDPHFIHALCELPTIYNPTSFVSFLKEFGTHIIVKIRFGHIFFERTYPAARPAQKQLTETDNDIPRQFLSNSPDFSVMRRQILANKSSTPVLLTLRSISYFITKSRIAAPTLPLECREIFSNETSLENLRKFLDRALLAYADEFKESTEATSSTMPSSAVELLSSTATESSKQLTGWPSGTYGLLEAADGCPIGQWRKGQRFQDLEDHGNQNSWSSGFQQKTASLFTTEGVRLNFCVKTTAFEGEEPREWPPGAYCLFKKGSCPNGFSASHVDHDDENTNNGNWERGILPDGFYTVNTRYFFCCRMDGDPHDPIQLPTDTPFILLRAGFQSCQKVTDMDAEPLWLFTDCEDFIGGCRLSVYGVAHPGITSVHGDWQWNFCYYSQTIHLNLYQLLKEITDY